MFVFRNPHSGDMQPLHHQKSEPSADLSEVKADIERLYFITEALWRILREKHGLDDLEIIRQITTIDMEDGKLDGRKAKAPPQPCPKCGRPRGKQRTKCMYGGELIAVNPFDR